jgi:hypothetical protein
LGTSPTVQENSCHLHDLWEKTNSEIRTYNYYASVIGQLQCLQEHTRIDINMAQCVRFTHNPMRSQELALEQTGRSYDLWVAMISRSTAMLTHTLLGYGDTRTNKTQPRSRAEQYTLYSSLPELTKTIAQALGSEFQVTKREPIEPFKSAQFEIYVQFETAAFKTTLHRGNTGATILAKMEPGRITPRSKYYGAKYHCFRTKLKPNRNRQDRYETPES